MDFGVADRRLKTRFPARFRRERRQRLCQGLHMEMRATLAARPYGRATGMLARPTVRRFFREQGRARVPISMTKAHPRTGLPHTWGIHWRLATGDWRLATDSSSLSPPPAGPPPSTPPSRLPTRAPWASRRFVALAPPGRLWLRPFRHSRAPPCRDGRGPAGGPGAPHHRVAAGARPGPASDRRCSSGRCSRRPRSPALPPAAAAASPRW